MQMAVKVGERVLPKAESQAALAEISRVFREKQERAAQIRAMSRRPGPRESASVRFAMRCIEHRIVRGLWVLELALPSDGPSPANRHGLDYMNDRSDVDARYTDAAGGKWEAPPPRHAIPSSKEIDAAKEAKGWIEWLGDEQARLLTVAALSKRGDRDRRVNWDRVTSRLPQLRGANLRTLRDRYDAALRYIVAELTVQRMSA